MDSTYHIYAKNKCLYHNLNKEEFNQKWAEVNHLVGLMKTDYNEADLSYIELKEENERELLQEHSY